MKPLLVSDAFKATSCATSHIRQHRLAGRPYQLKQQLAAPHWQSELRSQPQSQTLPLCCCASSSKPVLNDDNPLTLAFLGDAIWTLYVRRHFLSPPKHFRLYHSAVRPYVTAEGQAAIYDTLLSSQQQLLSPDERAFLRRVRAWEDVKLRKRFSTPAAADVYRKATALEALVGHLHLHNPERLTGLVESLLPPASTTTTPAQSTDVDDDASDA